MLTGWEPMRSQWTKTQRTQVPSKKNNNTTTQQMGNHATGWCGRVTGCDLMLRSRVVVGRDGGLRKQRIECQRVINAYHTHGDPRLPRRTRQLLRFIRDGRPGNRRFISVPVPVSQSSCVLVEVRGKSRKKATVEIIELVRHRMHRGVPLWVILACLADGSRRTDSAPDQGVEHDE